METLEKIIALAKLGFELDHEGNSDYWIFDSIEEFEQACATLKEKL